MKTKRPHPLSTESKVIRGAFDDSLDTTCHLRDSTPADLRAAYELSKRLTGTLEQIIYGDQAA